MSMIVIGVVLALVSIAPWVIARVPELQLATSASERYRCNNQRQVRLVSC